MFELVDSFFKGASDNLREIEKYLNRQLIYHVLAPQKLSEVKRLQDDYSEKTGLIADQTKTAMTTILNQLDTSIKGEWSNKIQTVMTEEVDKYDDI